MPGLGQSKLFSTLTEEELRFLSTSTVERHFPPKTEVFRELEPGDGIYIVGEGLVQVSALVAEGDRRVLGRLGPGDFFGEMAVLDDEPRSATATTELESTLYFIPRESVRALLESSPRLALRLVREFSLRMREFNRRYVEEVVQAERLTMVGRFARTIVHDFKNPLNIIGLSADLLKMEKATPELRQKATLRIQRQVERLSGMISELLEFTRGTQHSVVPEPISFQNFVHEVVEELRPEAGDKRVSLVLRNQPSDALVLIDQKRLRHVFTNLVNNAIDVMPSGGTVFFSFDECENELVTHIEDTGPGIPAEILPRLFETFATFGKANGTGLGLSICKRIIEDHKGWIRATIEPGRGAIFSFALPITR